MRLQIPDSMSHAQLLHRGSKTPTLSVVGPAEPQTRRQRLSPGLLRQRDNGNPRRVAEKDTRIVPAENLARLGHSIDCLTAAQ